MITNEQITLSLSDFNGWRGAPSIPNIEQSESMQRLVRCWFDQVLKHCKDTRGEGGHHHHPYHDLMVRIAGGKEPEQAYRGWFNHFAMPVISNGMCGIHHWESRLRNAENRDTAIATLLEAELAKMLQPFKENTVNAFYKLREAEQLLGLPSDYYMQRRRDDLGDRDEGINKMWKWKAAGNKGYFQFTRTPAIEPWRSNEPELAQHLAARDALASVAFIIGKHERQTTHLAKRGKKSFEQWAIRKLWDGICEPFSYIGCVPEIEKPWATMRDVLALCNASVDSEMVRKTIKAGE